MKREYRREREKKKKTTVKVSLDQVSTVSLRRSRGLSRDGAGPGLVVAIYIVPVPNGHDVVVFFLFCFLSAWDSI